MATSFGPMSANAEGGSDTTLDAALGGRLRLRQPRHGHRFGHDGVLLAAATSAGAGDHVVDLGSGVGIAGLALARRCGEVRVALIDRDAALVAMAAENAAANGLADRVRAILLDVGASAAAFAAEGLAPGSAQAVMMNPPFNPDARFAPSPDSARRSAHVAGDNLLSAWVAGAERLLAPGGALTAVWRADGVADVLAALVGPFGGVTALPVYPRPGADAIRVLVRARKGSRAPFRLGPGVLLNGDDGRPTAEAEAILRGGEALPSP